MSQIPALLPKDKYNETLLANVHPADWQNPIPATRYNLVVIGAGSAGLVAAAAAAGLGGKVALIERHFMGGDCLNVGCVPSKALIRASRAVADVKQAATLGVHVPPEQITVDFGAVMEHVRRSRATISAEDSTHRYRNLGVDVFLGEGRFTGPDTIQVGQDTLHFHKAVIATGARAMELPIDGLAEAGYLTNETVFSLTEQPRRLGVIGAGPIGSELAQAFRRLGSEVVVFDMLPQVLGREDEEAAAIVERTMRREGVEFILSATLQRVTQENGQKVIHFEHAGQQKSLAFDEILSAAGRVPNVEGLNLEAAGVEYHKKGVTVNDYLQTTNPNIYAAGDIAMKYQFTHAADAAARIVIQNALFMGRAKLSALTIPWCTYTDPEVAHVGLYPAEAEGAGLAVETFTTPLEQVHRAVTDGEEEGFVKVHVQQGTDKILGATIVASHAGEMINEITTAMVGGLGLKTLAKVIHPYPTQAEAIKKVADGYNRTRLTPTIKKAFSGWLGWRANEQYETQQKIAVAAGATTATALALVGLRKVFKWLR